MNKIIYNIQYLSNAKLAFFFLKRILESFYGPGLKKIL